jgi:3-oxoacyl-[acyl-carrier-protein] synthase-1
MRRVAVTGMGIVSCLGANTAEVWQSLREGRSGIRVVPEMKELGYEAPVAGLVDQLATDEIGKKPLQTMSAPARYAAVATLEALGHARLPREMLRSARAAVVVGTSVGGVNDAATAEALLMAHKSPGRVGATATVRIMNSTAALNLAAWLGVKGRSYSLSSACATGTDSIGQGYELIRHGIVDLCVCGGAEGAAWRHYWASGDARVDDVPEVSSDDRDRPGAPFSEGAGILLLESLDHAEQRQAPVVAELVGYGSANDGESMFEARGRGLTRAIEQALAAARETNGTAEIDCIHAHGTGTRRSDVMESEVIRRVFGEPTPPVASTNPLNGHSLGAAGAHEAIFTLLMLQHDTVIPTPKPEHVATGRDRVQPATAPRVRPLQTVMTFNTGRGGNNACLIFTKR